MSEPFVIPDLIEDDPDYDPEAPGADAYPGNSVHRIAAQLARVIAALRSEEKAMKDDLEIVHPDDDEDTPQADVTVDEAHLAALDAAAIEAQGD